MESPHWEHGYRCHGYWIGAKYRIGLVALDRDFGSAVTSRYNWYFEPPTQSEVSGNTTTLRAAKREIEKLYAEWLKLPEDERAKRIDHALKAWK